MDELLELFNEMVKFEEEMKNNINTRLATKIFTRQAFKTYTEERFNQIKNISSSEWIDEVKYLKCA